MKAIGFWWVRWLGQDWQAGEVMRTVHGGRLGVWLRVREGLVSLDHMDLVWGDHIPAPGSETGST